LIAGFKFYFLFLHYYYSVYCFIYANKDIYSRDKQVFSKDISKQDCLSIKGRPPTNTWSHL